MGELSVRELRPELWEVRAEVAHAGRTASGAYQTTERPGPQGQPHGALAEALAWHALGEAHLAAGTAEAAIACAQRGLDALGDGYAAPTAIDDTALKLYAAEALIEEGDLASGASTMLRVLATRAQLYRAQHQLPEA